MNNLKTVALLSLMSALVWMLGWALFGGSQGIYIGLGFAALLNLGAYFFSAKMALAMSRARPVTEQELPKVYGMVRRLAASSNMPVPSIHLIDSAQPNAFATGRNPKNAAVAVTTGILEIMRDDELEGVIAHELSHVRNRDILISSIAAMLAAALSIFARMAFWFGGGGRRNNNAIGLVVALAAMILAPLAGMVIRMAISRAREYQADRSGAEMTGQPLSLARALQKIGSASGRIPMDVNPAVSQLFIADPLKAFGRRRPAGAGRMFSTHPPIEERVRRLENMYYRI
ncbi:MAG: zinc metalloprotease HtpX [bacterium]|nr:zinc metalloprotease HtpX [bacterium]MDE0353529.1 zinc metalloprotease HtpX [bacterium]